MNEDRRRVLVTGGAGFIGSAVVRKLLNIGCAVLNVDRLTYAANRTALDEFKHARSYQLSVTDICNVELVERLFKEFRPDGVIHLAAES